MRRAAVVLVLLVATTFVASAVAADRRHAVPGQGLSLAVPTTWVVTDAAMSAAALESLRRENPRLAAFIPSLSGPGSPMKFVAVDPRIRDGFATNVNVVVTPAPATISLAAYGQALVAGLRQIGVRAPRRSTVTLPGGRAIRLEYRVQLRVGGKTLTTRTLQYAFLRPARSVVVTYTTLPPLASRYAATFRRSAASIRFAN